VATRSGSRLALGAVLLLFACGDSEEGPTRPDPVTAECRREMAAQLESISRDMLDAQETFTKHPAEEELSGPPAEVDLDSSRYARAFRTKLREEVAAKGVNFAGAYSLVSVGMTGWGDNWYIVDRRTGAVTLFPYYAAALDFRESSNLLVMNPKHAIRELLHEQDVDCHFLNHRHELTSLRSFYFLWKDGQLVRLGPTDIDPPRNHFWDEYLPPPVTTDRKSYALSPGPHGPQATIVTTFHAPADESVSVANCNGAMSLGLQRPERDRWVNAWTAEINGCASAPIVIPPGGQHPGTITARIEPGTYRAVWHGIELPVEERVSAPFTIEAAR
jgi:hypothetical protein